jgi:serine/threonine protein kinase/Flp pilus assembly protein TadD
MTPSPPNRWQRIALLLGQALDLPSEERGPFLDRTCGGDPALRAEVEDLLRADSEAGKFLGAPVDLSVIALGPGDDAEADAAPGAGLRAERLAGTTIGAYKLVREIGRGGMGVVYEAEQNRPRRRVALKVILGGRHVDATTVRRFEREAESLARLKHPGIAAIYESGCTDEGQHFFAMEFVPGGRLSDVLNEMGVAQARPDVRRRLALFRKIAAALIYAHQRGVIHRDLKPSNIHVLPPGGGAADTPDIKVLDFGLARIIDPEGEHATAFTALGSIQGTLPYMSPEQVRGRRDDVDVRTDVYALGVILYRMLAGRLPYDLEGADLPEAARIICEQPPLPLAAAGGPRKKFDRDLSIIVLKALEKDPARRYPTVAALDEDLGRYLSGQPILARPASAAYQVRKLVARHRVAFAAAAAVLAALLVFAVVTTVQARRIAAERDRASREATTAARVSDFLTGLFKVSDPDETRGNSITAREILETGVEKIGRELADEPEIQARLMQTMGKVYASLGLYPKALPVLEQSVATRRRLLGEEHPDTLAAMSDLARLYGSMGRRAEAEKLDDQILQRRRRLLGEEHPETLEAMAALAFVYRTQGRLDEAETLDRRVLEARRRVLGEDHPDTLESLTELASVYNYERRYAEAEALYRPAIEKLRRVLGEDHSVTLKNIVFLADVYAAQRRYVEAERLHRDTRERLRRLLGDDHPLTIQATNNLASLFADQGRYADAEPLFRDNLDRKGRVLGANHPSTLTGMGNLAIVYASEGRIAEAEALFHELLEKQRRVLGEGHAETAGTLYNLGCLSARRGNLAGALDWIGQAVAHGYSHGDDMARDPDLKPLHADPAFDAIVAKARRNAGKKP